MRWRPVRFRRLSSRMVSCKRSYRSSRVEVMPRGRPSAKIAISVAPEVHEGIVAAAAESGVSVSAWMTEAARRALLAREGLAGCGRVGSRARRAQ